MILPRYCKACDAITGHDTGVFRSHCIKCGNESRTPLLHFAAGIICIIIAGSLLAYSLLLFAAMLGF